MHIFRMFLCFLYITFSGYGDPKYPLLEYKLIEFYYNPNVHVEK